LEKNQDNKKIILFQKRKEFKIFLKY
jgi:hypothetical protein